MENFLIEWFLVAMGLAGAIGVYNVWAQKRGGTTLMFGPGSIWPQGKYLLGLFFIAPFALLSFFF